jgi:hypothetical protein
MPSHDILGNDALVAPAALARAVVPLFVFYTGPDRRFVQEMQDQFIKRSSSVKELGDWRRSQLREWQPWVETRPSSTPRERQGCAESGHPRARDRTTRPKNC